MPLLSPLQSPEVREICAHLTKAESNLVSLLGLILGIWIVAAVFGIPLLIKSFPRPGNWIAALVFSGIFILTLPMLSRIGRQFLCSTAWAKKQGFAPERLNLFSLQGNNLWKAITFLVLGLLLVVAQEKAITSYFGLNAGMTNRFGSSTNFFIGQTYFPKGDSIEITSVERTENQMTVNGHYNLVSADEASLWLNITATNNDEVPNQTEPPQSLHISKGAGDFELSRSRLMPGLPHVSMYNNHHAFAGIYFGTKDEAAVSTRLNLSDYQPSNDTLTKTFSFGPIVERAIRCDANDAIFGIDLESGRVWSNTVDKSQPVTNATNQMTGEELFAGKGVDAMGFGNTAFPQASGLLCINGMFAMPVDAVDWDNMAAETVSIHANNLPTTQEPLKNTPEFMKMTVMLWSEDGLFPKTYVFNTRAGSSGLLQIVGLTNNPLAVKIRYRLLQNSGGKK
jgi:hypothetical protein